MHEWSTNPPPINIELKLETVEGISLAGVLSYVGAYRAGTGQKRYQYKLKGAGGIFEVARWRRV